MEVNQGRGMGVGMERTGKGADRAVCGCDCGRGRESDVRESRREEGGRREEGTGRRGDVGQGQSGSRDYRLAGVVGKGASYMRLSSLPSISVEPMLL